MLLFKSDLMSIKILTLDKFTVSWTCLEMLVVFRRFLLYLVLTPQVL